MNVTLRYSPLRAIALTTFSLGLFALQGCAFSLVNATTPSSGYSRVETFHYGGTPRQTLDFYTPTTPNSTTDILVFFYGGAWQKGKKEDYRFIAQAFTDKGYAIAIPDYRVYPEVLFPEFVKDGALALAEIKKEHPESQFILIGHSAGAHIAALLALDESYLKDIGLSVKDLKAWVGWSGPYDFLPIKGKKLQTIFSGANNIEDTQPINFVSADAPSSLLIQGLDDHTVIPRNTENLTARLKETGSPVETIYYPGVGHVGTVASLAPVLSAWANTLDDTLNFIESLDQNFTHNP